MIRSNIEHLHEGSAPEEWPAYEEDRRGLHQVFPFSAVVETTFLEMEKAEDHLRGSLGLKDLAWNSYWYYKKDYDYGYYMEFFFMHEEDLQGFVNHIPEFYGASPDGKRFRSNGINVFIDFG